MARTAHRSHLSPVDYARRSRTGRPAPRTRRESTGRAAVLAEIRRAG